MNWLEIEQLLKKFWDGETSVEEEHKLKLAFSREDVPENLSSFKSYFGFVTNEKKVEHPEKNFENKLTEKLISKSKHTLSIRRLLPYAAGFILLISSLFFLREENDSTNYKPLTEKELQLAQKYLGFFAENIEHTMSFSAQNLEKINLLNIGTNTIKQYKATYQKPLSSLNKVEHINHSFIQLKYLKTFENSKIKL